MSTPNTFTIGEALSNGWALYRKHAVFLVTMFICIGGVTALLDFATERAAEKIGLLIILYIIFYAVQIVIAVGLVNTVLLIVRGRKVTFQDFFVDSRMWIVYLLAAILYGVGIMVGLALLIVPGIIVLIMWQFFSYALVDKGLSARDSLRYSARITKGNRWKLLWFNILIGLMYLGIGAIFMVISTITIFAGASPLAISLIGFCVIGAGFLTIAPMTILDTAHVYTTLAKGKTIRKKSNSIF